MLDMLIWLFGSCQGVTRNVLARTSAHMVLEFERATVNANLSVDKGTRRALDIHDVATVNLDDLGSLHTKAYNAITTGRGLTLADARPSIELAHRLRLS